MDWKNDTFQVLQVIFFPEILETSFMIFHPLLETRVYCRKLLSA